MSMGNWPFLSCSFPDNQAGHHSLGCNALCGASGLFLSTALEAWLNLCFLLFQQFPGSHAAGSLAAVSHSLLCWLPHPSHWKLHFQAKRTVIPPQKKIISFQSTPVDSSQEKTQEATFLPAQPVKAM